MTLVALITYHQHIDRQRKNTNFFKNMKLLIFAGIVTASLCAPLEWTWLSGEEALFARGYESALFLERFSVSPSARSFTSSCYDPVTSKFFLFSGYGVFMRPELLFGHLCDLWSYDTGAGLWSKLRVIISAAITHVLGVSIGRLVL